MANVLGIGLRTTLVTLVLTGLLYPLAVTAIAQLVAPARANGSLVSDEHGRMVGSELIAQGFTNPAYFQPRPSAAGPSGYDATASGGSNLGPTSQKLEHRIAADLARLQKDNPNAAGPVPSELLTTSASGLDPDLSPDAARWQVPRVARARHVDAARILAVLEARIDARTFGLLGEPRTNVLLLNLALDRQFGRPDAASKPSGPSQESSTTAQLAD
jgi:K+-transporting ATPase ATPase C chain